MLPAHEPGQLLISIAAGLNASTAGAKMVRDPSFQHLIAAEANSSPTTRTHVPVAPVTPVSYSLWKRRRRVDDASRHGSH